MFMRNSHNILTHRIQNSGKLRCFLDPCIWHSDQLVSVFTVSGKSSFKKTSTSKFQNSCFRVIIWVRQSNTHPSTSGQASLQTHSTSVTLRESSVGVSVIPVSCKCTGHNTAVSHACTLPWAPSTTNNLSLFYQDSTWVSAALLPTKSQWPNPLLALRPLQRKSKGGRTPKTRKTTKKKTKWEEYSLVKNSNSSNREKREMKMK